MDNNILSEFVPNYITTQKHYSQADENNNATDLQIVQILSPNWEKEILDNRHNRIIPLQQSKTNNKFTFSGQIYKKGNKPLKNNTSLFGHIKY